MFLRLTVWFGSLLLDTSVHIAKLVCVCCLDILMFSFFRKYFLPCFSSLLWQRHMQVLNILRPCSAMDQEERVFFIIHLTREAKWMISQYVYFFFLCIQQCKWLNLPSGEKLPYISSAHMPSHLRHSPWQLKGIRTHPALQLSVIKSEGVWQGFCLLPFHIV